MLKRTGIILSALLAMSLLLAACDSLTGDDNGEDDAAPPQQEETPAEGETPEAEETDDETATPEGDATPSPEATEDEEAEETPDGETAEVDGEAIFMRECAACHGEDGGGNELDGSSIPPHNGNPIVTAEDPISVVSVVLTGRGGMPRFDGVLADEEIAAVISYIRGAWDNDAEPVEPATIDEIRQETIPGDDEGVGGQTQGAGDQEDDEDEEDATPTEESDDET